MNLSTEKKLIDLENRLVVAEGERERAKKQKQKQKQTKKKSGT